jgi:hypothetical protein
MKLVDGSATPVGQPIGCIMPSSSITYNRHWMPFIPLDQSEALVGRLNHAPFRIGRRWYPRGTLCYLGLTSGEEYDTIGGVQFTVGYKFQARRVDWNYVWNPATGLWTYCTHDGTNGGYPTHPYGDFTYLPG